MTNRLLILIAFAIVLVAGYYGLRAWQGWRLRALQAAPRLGVDSPLAGVLAELAANGPTLLYFTTETCAQCRFQQAPILQQLQAMCASLPVLTLDAVQRQDLAGYFGIMTVPSTVLLDAQHRPVAINHGVAPLQKLQAQVATIR